MKDEGEIPDRLDMALKCRRWNTLPVSGGLLDQPAGLMNQLDYALRIFTALSEYNQKVHTGGKEFVDWQMKNKAVVNLVTEIIKDAGNG